MRGGEGSEIRLFAGRAPLQNQAADFFESVEKLRGGGYEAAVGARFRVDLDEMHRPVGLNLCHNMAISRHGNKRAVIERVIVPDAPRSRRPPKSRKALLR